MMPDRKMFWRIIRRLLSANRGRLFVILLALGAGAAITAALLNLQVDAKRRLTAEFRTFGANVIIAPRDFSESAAKPRLYESLFSDLSEGMDTGMIPKAAFLYGVANASIDAGTQKGKPPAAGNVIVAGFLYSGNRPDQAVPAALVEAEQKFATRVRRHCDVGQQAAAALHLRSGDSVRLTNGAHQTSCDAYVLPALGGSEDSQVFVELHTAQTLFDQQGYISLIQLSIPGTPGQIQNYISLLQQRLRDVDVRPVRQFTEGEARIYQRISGILSATVALVLVLTTLCVMAAMTNVAMERRNDVGLMKAIGGATRRVLRLFVAEAALLGLTGGVLGAATGILISMWLGKAVFGVAARPRLIVYPVAVALTIIVAIAGAYPLRRLANIRPASVFRGER
jgi:putative ABC transport system permease protein